MTSVDELLHDDQFEPLAIRVDRSELASATSATYVIHQDVCYTYDAPITELRQRLVVVPRVRHGDQRRVAHRFEVRSSGHCHVDHRTDRFGNAVVDVATAAVHGSIEFRARAVLTRSTQRTSRAAWPAARPTTTTLTAADDGIRQAAAELGGASNTASGTDTAHIAETIADFVHRSFEYRHDVTSVRTSAAEAWRIKQGVCQDMAHVMIAMCSSLGIAARYVSGHLVGDGASHAWVEVFDAARRTVVAIDPTHARQTDLRYVTTATGRDYRDVAPTVGTYVALGAHGRLAVRKTIRLAQLG